MNSDFILAQLRVAAVAVIAYAGGRGWFTPADSALATALLTSIGPIIAPWIASIYATYGTKKVPQNAIAIVAPDGDQPLPKVFPSTEAHVTIQGITSDGGVFKTTGAVVGCLLAVLIVYTMTIHQASAASSRVCWACVHGCTPLTQYLNCGAADQPVKKKRPTIKRAALDAFAQAPKQSIVPLTTSACDPVAIFKGLTPANFAQRIKLCADDDLDNAIKDAQTDPVDFGAQACLIPLRTLRAGIIKGGFLTGFQAFRRAKNSGLISGCLNYVNSTVLVQ